jgi:hypothetical protein
MEWRSRRTIAGFAAVAALATGGGVAYATTQGDDSGPGANLADVAARLGVTEEELRGAFQAEALEQIDAAVAAGDLTEAQAARIRDRIESGEPPFRFHDRSSGGGPFQGDGPFGGDGPPDGVAPAGGMLFGGIDAAAEYLGLEPGELFDQLRSGKTLAEIAEAQGKSVDGLEQALLDQAREAIHTLVTEGFQFPELGAMSGGGPPFRPGDEQPPTGSSS